MTESVFNEIIDRYGSPIISVIYKMIQDNEIAQDLAQDVFVRLWENRNSIDLSKPIFTYLYKLAMNRSVDYLRKKKPQSTENEILELMVSQKPEDTEELFQLIIKCADFLKAKQKAVFILRDIEGFKFDEIAKVLEMPLSNIQSNLHLARKRVRELLETKYQVNWEYIYDL